MATQTQPKCPKGKVVYAANTPDGRTVYRASARGRGHDYTHACAVHSATAQSWAIWGFSGSAVNAVKIARGRPHQIVAAVIVEDRRES